jgi:polyhydroxyalkanoate synthesis regulator phasin
VIGLKISGENRHIENCCSAGRHLDSSDRACYNSVMTQCVNSDGKGLPMEQPDKGRCLIAGALRRAMLFGVGSALVLQEKSAEFAKQALERGQEAQDEGRKLVQKRRADRKKRHPTRIDPLDVRINASLERLNVPSQKEINELNQHIVELSQRIDELKSAN